MRGLQILSVLAGIWTLVNATPACAIASTDKAAGYATQDGALICHNRTPHTVVSLPSASPKIQFITNPTPINSFHKLELRFNLTSNSSSPSSTGAVVYYTPLPGVSAKSLTTKHTSTATRAIAAGATTSSSSVSTAGSVATAIPWGSKGAGVALGVVGFVIGAL